MYISGKNVIKEYLNSNNKIKKVFISKSFNDSSIIEELNKRQIKTTLLDKYELDKVSSHNQGIIIEVDDYDYYTLEDINTDLIVILDHLEDPHNFGAIIRSCEAAGIKYIIIPKDRSVSVNETVMKTSVGALNYVNIIMVTNINQAISELKDKGFWFVGMDMDGEDYKEIDYTGKIGLIVGSEGNGLGNLVRKNCDFIASIPMKGKVNSLNASVAAAVIIFEAVSKRR